MWNNSKISTCISLPLNKDRQNRTRRVILEEIMTEGFPKLMKTVSQSFKNSEDSTQSQHKSKIKLQLATSYETAPNLKITKVSGVGGDNIF